MSHAPVIQSDSSGDQPQRAPETATSIWTATKRLIRAPSLSRIQALVGTAAGIVSIGGALFSVVHAVRPASTGNLIAIVAAAGSRATVADATIEVLTPQNAIVATLKPDATGRATQELREGTYIVRISHPRYALEVRRIQVVPQQTVEVRANLHGGSSSSIDHAVNSAVGAVRRALRF